MKRIVSGSLYAILLFSILACGTLQISIVGSPTPDAAVTGTMGALQTQIAGLGTRMAKVTPAGAPSTGPTISVPVGTPLPSAVPATRITFLRGATVGVVSAPIGAGQTQTYIVDVYQSQPMYVYVASANHDVSVSIRAEDGAVLLRPDANAVSWQGNLTQTGDYYLTLHGGSAPENFTLTVTIPTRLQFAAGADSATVSGTTVAGYNVGYVLYASKGQTMSVDIENVSSKASLSIIGFTDGQNYLSSKDGQRSYQFVLPSTQDYIITVVPMGGLAVTYTMTIRIQ